MKKTSPSRRDDFEDEGIRCHLLEVSMLTLLLSLSLSLSRGRCIGLVLRELPAGIVGDAAVKHTSDSKTIHFEIYRC